MVSKNEIASTLTRLIDDFVTTAPFFLFWKPNQVDRVVAERFLVSFDSLVKTFPSLIAAGTSRMEDAESRTVLAVNLYQECGEGEVNRSHHTIYRNFLKTAGINLSAITEDSFAVEWRNRLFGYIQQSGQGEVLGALAAGEFLAQPALGRIYPVLKAHYPQADQEYFTKHLALETEHVEEITAIIERQSGDFEEVVDGFKFGLEVWKDYFDNLTEHLNPKTILATD